MNFTENEHNYIETDEQRESGHVDTIKRYFDACLNETPLGCDPGGSLTCNQDCTFDSSQCTACPACGNGICELGETCISCATDCIFESAQTCGNGLCETADGEDCETCPTDCRSNLGGNPSTRFCCGGGEYAVDCTDDRCSDTYTTCVNHVTMSYCCGDTICQGAEG